MKQSIKSALRAFLLWKEPFKKRPLPVFRDYEIEQCIHDTNQLFLVRIQNRQYYFRPLEPSLSSLASACRSLGTEELGRLLGMRRFHPDSKAAELPGLGRGVLQSPADGFCIMPVSKTRRLELLSPVFQREINDLNVLDALCYETDHSPNNYNVTAGPDGRLRSLCVFDNNGLGTFACRSSLLFTTQKKLSPIVTEGGCVNRPHLSRETAERLEKLRLGTLYSHMRHYLKPIPIVFLYLRTRRLKRAIRRSARRDPAFLLPEDGWSEESLRQELSGAYGKTYLLGFLQDCAPRESESHP